MEIFRLPNGQRILAEKGDLLDEMVMAGLNLNPFCSSALKQYINATEDIFLDIGAYKGFFSVYSQFLPIKPRTICVEPQSKCINLIIETMILNAISFEVRKVAVSNCYGLRNLYLGPPNNLGASSLLKKFSSYHSNRKIELVDVVPGNSLLEESEWNQVRVIKLDVEGMEYQVVKSLPLHNLKKCAMVVELTARNPMERMRTKMLYSLMSKNKFDYQYGPQYPGQWEEVFIGRDLEKFRFQVGL
jgi:FkbM family methyltransferase